MPTKTRIEQEILLFIDVTIEKDEYNEFKDKIRTQYLKNVEVPGFRKGKAPSNLALEQINPSALEQTILQEAVDKFGHDAMILATDEMTKSERHVIAESFQLQTETLKNEENLSFTIKGEMLPQIELDPSKITVVEPSAKDLPDRISYEEFLSSQKNGFISGHVEYEDTTKGLGMLYKFTSDTTGIVDGKDAPQLTTKDMNGVIGVKQFIPDFETGVMGMKLGEEKSFDVQFPVDYHSPELAGKKATFTAKIKEIQAPKSTDFNTILKSSHEGHDHGQFSDEAAFDTYIKNYYDGETDQLLEQQKQRNTVKALIDQVKDFPIDEERVTTERDRIFEVLKSNAEGQGVAINEIFVQSGIPGSEKGAKDEMDIKAKIESYVRSEFKLSTIWDFIYATKVEQKVTVDQIEQGAKDVLANPSKYNLGSDMTEDQAKNYAYNNLKKNRSAAWLFAQLKETKEETKPAKKTAKK
jgi:trigger factor